MNEAIRIERTRNRTSRASIRDGQLVIRLARHLSPAEEHQHITWLTMHMQDALARERSRIPVDPFRPLLEGATTLVIETNLGTRWNIRLIAAKRETVRCQGEELKLGIPQTFNTKKLHRHLWKVITRLMREDTDRLVRQINSVTFRSEISEVRLRTMSSQWGSCSAKGVITLNTSLLFVPKDLLTYVIIHELAHTHHKNHSAKFWKAVSDYDVNFSEHRKNLKQMRIIRI